MNKLLVVEDEVITSDLLRRYFEMVGYEVINALTGTDAIEKANDQLPEVIILDIMLPDMDGYEICRRLRANERTNRIPIIFLTQKDERRDRLDGLGLGADDYITKPFDVEELRLRVHNIINRVGGTSLVDARTSLPNMDLIKERLPKLLNDPASIFVDIQIESLFGFEAKYGPVAANQVIRSSAKLIGDLLHQVDPTSSFIGHPRDDHFLIAIKDAAAERVEKELPEKFAELSRKFYSSDDLEAGHMETEDGPKPLMKFKLVRISAQTLKNIIKQMEEREAGRKRAEQDKPASSSEPSANGPG
ncbi:MAG: response regulator transcription factor [Chloroflexi bacterium]|nr:response regulator transcription factor [Chloroflexota bacterium]